MKVAITRSLTVFLTLALAVVVVYWVSQAQRESKLLLYLIAVLPLIPWVRGLLHGVPKAYMSLAVVSLLYLLHGSVEAFSFLSCNVPIRTKISENVSAPFRQLVSSKISFAVSTPCMLYSSPVKD